MKKGRDFDQGATIVLINTLKKEEMKGVDNEVNMNNLECQRLQKVFQNT